MPRVLVVGPRKGLRAALEERAIDYVVWSERSRRMRGAEHVHFAPVDVSPEKAREEVDKLASLGPFTHVIAGTEAAVIPAAVARRGLAARTYAHSTVLRGRDKLRMKRFFRRHGVPMTPFLDGNELPTHDEVVEALGFPIVLKPRLSSGGRGMSLLGDRDSLDRAATQDFILEKYVDAPELSVESFVHEGQITFRSMTEYVTKTRINVVPAGISEKTRTAIQELNDRVITALDLKWGMTHLEVYLTPEGPLFGEIALRPPGGYIMELIQLAWGFDPWQAMLAVELGEEFDFPARPGALAAGIILHPGRGTLVSMDGVGDVERMAEVVNVTTRVKIGDVIETRAGVGQDVGNVLLRCDSRERLLDALVEVDARLIMRVE